MFWKGKMIVCTVLMPHGFFQLPYSEIRLGKNEKLGKLYTQKDSIRDLYTVC